jgi:hypothetical protein
MSTEKIDLQKIFEGLDKGLLNEETQTKLSSLINETVDARVSAKEKLLTEEIEKVKKALEDDKTKFLVEKAENEKVLVEQAEKYKKELEETVIEETVKYKTKIDTEKDAEIAKFQKDAEEVLLAEAKEFKTKQDAVLVEEVKNFKAELVEKVSDYLQTKLSQDLIPAEIMESATKMAVLEPLVAGIMETFSENYVKIDTTSFKLLSEAKTKISALESAIDEKSKAEIKLKREKKDVERLMKLNTLTEGLTRVQKEKAVKLLEGVELEQLDSRFVKIRDIITESNTAQIKPVTKPITQTAKIEKIEESVKKVESIPTEKTEADKAVIDHQVKKILTESEVKQITTGKKPEVPTQIGAWASKLKK